ncbi:glycosyltransferase [Flavobacterium columnare]|uniref:glycosyltransferase n=1 Tax=Flavobacterium columnare TaxID=996 RepID=UPI00403447DD
MKVSIIIPIYNSEQTIQETIDSIENQGYSQIEIIFVNDGSIDKSKKIVDKYISRSKFNCIYIEIQNSGPANARNVGVQHANYEYILFLDADDLLAKDYISKAIQIFDDNNEINLVYGNVELFGSEKGIWALKDYKMPDFLLENTIPIFAIHKKEHFIALGGFDLNLHFAEDWDLWIRLTKQYGGVYKMNEIVYHYRKHLHQDSLTDLMKRGNQIDRARLYIFNKHYDWYIENELNFTKLIHNTIRQNQMLEKKNKKIIQKIKKIFDILKLRLQKNNDERIF